MGSYGDLSCRIFEVEINVKLRYLFAINVFVVRFMVESCGVYDFSLNFVLKDF